MNSNLLNLKFNGLKMIMVQKYAIYLWRGPIDVHE